ncbi:stage II sporulation protein D [Paenibacillus alvei]|uniref:stage II sporulation protein D n=2 Tax=Paenibacillus alvei TaxID=44250 RepID=UPI0002885031|nr:stage II sporulation protein D [Paenibacillus alvei]EJW18444.1 stage II sporulation protein D [Paenibacillus alvei DSM 29]MCY9539614.1 stage II sporulation protein D [Paenibacillus alvei]MCY9703136.1 stage II sporulation protein D [Paenibacillus alvei]MCY9735643.1 stage II sporulation protein D [Paenibacillus alvei]MCY9752876.1 stage II sporulation protein D [Paenibacillus alvei]
MAMQPMLNAQARRLARWLKPRLGFRGRGRWGMRRRPLPLLARTALWAGALIALALLVPLLLVQEHQQEKDTSVRSERTAPQAQKESPGIAAAQPMVRVYLSGTRQIESIALEQYVRGVLAAEMPSSFELEALKAQAIAARTYIMRRLLAKDASGTPEGADVTNTVAHQAYKPLAEMKRLPKDAAAKLSRAVEETKDLIITYEGKPIMAAFFSTSNGYTENAEDYWGSPIPYLKSVPSPWDERVAPKYAERTTFQMNNLLSELGVSAQALKLKSDGGTTGKTASIQGIGNQLRIVSRTVGKRVRQVQIGSEHFTGREIREKLGLRSSAFDWSVDNDKLVITTYGFGHGVGMSQYGAQGMAKEGATAEQIVTYYYKDVKLDKASKLAADRTKG